MAYAIPPAPAPIASAPANFWNNGDLMTCPFDAPS
jgi:hypothetical protein